MTVPCNKHVLFSRVSSMHGKAGKAWRGAEKGENWRLVPTVDGAARRAARLARSLAVRPRRDFACSRRRAAPIPM